MTKFNTKNLGAAFCYFYIHFVTELVCFYILSSYIQSPPMTWLIYLIYDMLAFAPQSIIGHISDKFRKIRFGLIGLFLLTAAVLLWKFVSFPLVSLLPLTIGNACLHVNGAEVTLRVSEGKLSHSAIFVSGGSFGVISGKLMASSGAPFWLLLLPIISAVPFAILAQMYLSNKYDDRLPCANFNYNNKKMNKHLILMLCVFVVFVRGYMAYGIPTSWRKSTLQTIILFVCMGIGKAAGGILSDIFGMRKIALLSVGIALPLLMFGDNNMFVSLIGVMFFSMTMSVTLGLIASVLKNAPGLAFGLTTIGLFLGSLPIFFIKIKSFAVNCVMLSCLSVLCLVILFAVIDKPNKEKRNG